jgi:hypothetical protein
MQNSNLQAAAINQIGFDYFTSCINNGSTPEQAKKEMLTAEAQKIIAKRINAVL